jgi:protein SCO1/2
MTPAITQSETREAQFAAKVSELASTGGDDAIRALIGLCDEREPAYENQPASAIARMRGWVLHSLGRNRPLPDEALPFVLEELESSHDPYLLAVAAWCLRAYPQPLPSFRRTLDAALQNARAVEAPVMLGVYGGLGSNGSGDTSPMKELTGTLDWMGPDRLSASGGCCPELPESIVRLFRRKVSARTAARRRAVDGAALESHRGETRTFRQWVTGKPSIVAFFYTRCDNPLKCTLTIAKLSRVQKLLETRGLSDEIRTIGITYDPAYDTPERLLRYGRNRGFLVDSDHHLLLRATGGLEVLRSHFELGVSFFESIVSRHRIEVFILNREGQVAFTFQRLNWSEEQAVNEAAALLSGKPGTAVIAAAAPVAGLAASLVPKCPMCWATYLSLLGITGTLPVLGPMALKALAAVLLTVHLAPGLWRVRTTGWKLANTLSVAGVAAIATNVIQTNAVPGLAPAGAALMLLASLMTVRARYTSSAP